MRFDRKIFVPPSSKLKGIRVGNEEFLPNFISTGEINGEQSLIVKDGEKLIIFTGCSHNGLENVIKIAEKYGKIYGIIGGFHDFKNIDILARFSLVMPCHCTKLKRQIEAFPNALECMAGKEVEV